MAEFAVEIGSIDDKTLEFFGYFLVEENEEFKVYTDKYQEDHIVRKTKPLLYVEDYNDAVYLASGRIIRLRGLD